MWMRPLSSLPFESQKNAYSFDWTHRFRDIAIFHIFKQKNLTGSEFYEPAREPLALTWIVARGSRTLLRRILTCLE